MPEQTVLENTTKTAEEIFEDEKLTSEHDPMFLVKGQFLSIKTKDGKLIKLKLNEPQKKLLAKIEELTKLNKPVRLWVLKSRQEGISTVIEAVIYAFTSQRENVNSFIMADDDDHVDNVFEMSKLYQEQLEITDPHLTPTLKKSNEKKLEFEKIHSQIVIAVSRTVNAARSHAYQFAHLCMGENTQILVDQNYIKHMRDVIEGDKVITHLGHTAQIIGVSKNKITDIQKDNKLLQIKISGGCHFPIECTFNHKLFVRDKKAVFKRENGRGVWKEAKEVKKGDMLGLPLRILHFKKEGRFILPKKTAITGHKWIEGEVKLDFNFGFFCGLYLSEGCIVYNKGGIPSAVTLGMHQKEQYILDMVGGILKKYIKSYRIDIRKNSKTIVGVYYGISLAEFVIKLFGCKEDKKIPNLIWHYSKEFVLGMLKGYFDGDGHIPDDQDIIFASSIRPQILFQIRDILLGMRIGYSSIDYRKGGYHYGRNCKDTYILRIHGQTSKKLRGLLGYKSIERSNKTISCDWKMGTKHCWVKVNSVDQIESDYVYDIILDHKDHSYRLISGVTVHNSECAFFWDFREVMNALSQSVPETPGTMIIGETTANGMEDFYEEWVKAIEGKTDWIPVFIAWFELDEYKLPLQNGELHSLEGINFGTESSEREFIEEEKKLKEEFNLTDEQLNFRRYAIVNKCGGEIDVWNREFPSTWEVAFQTSGKMFFDRAGVKKQIPRDPKMIGELFLEDLAWKFRELPYGRVKIYSEPQLDEEYIVSCDASEGLPGQDEASIIVLDKRLNETAAVVNGFYSPEEIAHISIGLGNYYNQAMIAPENKGYGYMVCQLIYQKYGNIYRRQLNKTGETKQTEELGFNTNSITRPQMLALLGAEIKNNSTRLLSKELVSQCQTFIVDPKTKKPQAQQGKQDGLVIARSIAGVIRQQYPYVGKTFESFTDDRDLERYGMGARVSRPH